MVNTMYRVRRKLHRGHVYLGVDVLRRVGLHADSEVVIEVDEENRQIIIRPSDEPNEGTKKLLELLRNPPGVGGPEDFLSDEYDYEDIGGEI